MIAYLKGKILNIQENRLIVTNAALGYEIRVPISEFNADLYQPGSEVELYIHSHIREDAFDLYGFPSLMERDLFRLLLTVSGVGPKAALSILKQVDADVLILGIQQQNRALFTGIKGIGKKTVEKIFLDLQVAVEKFIEQYPHFLRNAAHTSASASPLQSQGEWLEAQTALRALGYHESDILSAFKRLAQEHGEQTLSTESWVKAALQEMRDRS